MIWGADIQCTLPKKTAAWAIKIKLVSVGQTCKRFRFRAESGSLLASSGKPLTSTSTIIAAETAAAPLGATLRTASGAGTTVKTKDGADGPAVAAAQAGSAAEPGRTEAR